MKRLLLLVLTLILVLPVFAHAEEDIVGFFMEPTTETSVLFPGVPDWSTVAASEDSAAAFAALALMDLERGCAKNGYEYPSDYDDVYLWTLDGTVYLTVYADVSVSMFVMDSGEWMVLMAVNREVADNAAEWVEMQLASGQMEDAIHITPEMLERGTLMALTGEFSTDASMVDLYDFSAGAGFISDWSDASSSELYAYLADEGFITDWSDASGSELYAYLEDFIVEWSDETDIEDLLSDVYTYGYLASAGEESGSSTYVPDNSQGEFVGSFSKEFDRLAEMFTGKVDWAEIVVSEMTVAQFARLTIEDLLTGCEENGLVPPDEFDRVFLWRTGAAVYLTVYDDMSYAVIFGDGGFVVGIAINESVASHAHEHMAYMVDSGQMDEFIYVDPSLLSGGAAAPAEPERTDNLPAGYARYAVSSAGFSACMPQPVLWSAIASDEAALRVVTEAILQDAVNGLADAGFDADLIGYAILREVKDRPVLYVSMGGGMWMLVPGAAETTAVWTPDHPAADSDPAVFAETVLGGGYYILNGDAVIAAAPSAAPAVGSLPENEGEYTVPATVTRRTMPFPTYWEDIADDPDEVALMAASILKDADAGLAEYGFDSAAAEYFILFNLTDFPQLYVSMGGGMWTLLPQSNDLLARWTPNHSASEEDPVEFAEWSLEITSGLIEAYFVLTPEEIERGWALLASEEGLREGDDWVAKFRMADKVYKYNSGYAPFVYQQQAAFISPTGEVLMAGEIDSARVFDDYGFAPVYQGPYSAGIAYGGLWGITDTKGSLVLPIEYSGMELTDDGIYSMPIEGGRAFFNPATMQYVTLTGYSEVAWQCSSGMIPVANGLVNEYGEEVGKLWGYINFYDGSTLDCQWDSVSYTWSNGCAYVQKDGKFGVINGAGELLIPCEWDGCSGIGEGFAVMWRKLPQEGLQQKEMKEFVVVSLDGTEAARFEAYSVTLQNVSGYLAVYRSFDNEGGLYTVTGTEVLPMEYSDIFMYSETCVLLGMQDENDEYHCGVFDMEQGVWLSEMQWEGRLQPGDGYYRVEKDGLYGYLNENFELVIPVQYEDGTAFSDGYALVKDGSGWKFIDKAGQAAF